MTKDLATLQEHHMTPEMIRALQPIVLSICGGTIAIFSLFSPHPKEGLYLAGLYGVGAAGLSSPNQNKIN
jgi:hypothetical protein